MKNLSGIIGCVFLVALISSCSRKRIPQKTASTPLDTTTSAPANQPVFSGSDETADSAVAITANKVMVVADGYGRLLTAQQNLPVGSGITYNNLQLSKGFTTQQRANMQARYKTIPPRVLYIPPQEAKSSLKGTYYIYKSKFWYWKKQDGLFYLDEKYYL